jgi:hypothetical protein
LEEDGKIIGRRQSNFKKGLHKKKNIKLSIKIFDDNYVVRSPTLARDMIKIAFINIVQTSTLKLAFMVECRPPKF